MSSFLRSYWTAKITNVRQRGGWHHQRFLRTQSNHSGSTTPSSSSSSTFTRGAPAPDRDSRCRSIRLQGTGAKKPVRLCWREESDTLWHWIFIFKTFFFWKRRQEEAECAWMGRLSPLVRISKRWELQPRWNGDVTSQDTSLEKWKPVFGHTRRFHCALRRHEPQLRPLVSTDGSPDRCALRTSFSATSGRSAAFIVTLNFLPALF